METVSRQLIRHAHGLACEVGAQALLVYGDAIAGDDDLRRLLLAADFTTVLITRSGQPPAFWDGYARVTVPDIPMTRSGQVKMALLSCLAKGLLRQGDRAICLTGPVGAVDSLVVLDLATEPDLFALCGGCGPGDVISPPVFERTLALATQLAAEGREGRPVGVIFIIGDSDAVLAQSRNLVLNPFHGYPEEERNILDPALEETVKEYSALDGAFVVRGDGVLLCAGAHLVPTAEPEPLPKGLGTRHAAAAGITASTQAVALVVSQSTGALAVFRSGRLVADIHRPVSDTRLAL